MPENKNLKPMMLREDASLIEAIKAIDAGQFGIAMVVDKNLHLIGVITDSDTRQALINGVDGGDSVAPYIIHNPVTASIEMDDDSIFALMQASGKHQIPILETPERWMVADSTPILQLLNSRINTNHMSLFFRYAYAYHII